MILMIDNFDSFTFTIVHYFRELNQTVSVYRNDAISIADIERIDPDYIVLSPGPGRPENAGITEALLTRFHTEKPILGICLGHQAIAEFFGGRVISSNKLVHGKTSAISHQQRGLFSGLPTPYEATRYHSLIVERSSLPGCLDVTAWTEPAAGVASEIMGIQHNTLPVFGVQFHPESILTEYGHELLANFIAFSKA